MNEQLAASPKNNAVEQALREAIVQGDLTPGEWVRTEEWARRLGVSQTPIREALQKLEGHGLVKSYPHRGFQIAKFDLTDFIEVYQIRAALEGLAAKLAVSKSSDEEVESLIAEVEESTAAFTQAAKQNDRKGLRQANRRFHASLHRAAKAPRLASMIDNLWATFPYGALAFVPGRAELVAVEHEEMLTALRRRDAERLGTLMANHIEAAAYSLLSHGQSIGVPVWEPAIRRSMEQGVNVDVSRIRTT
jgi:DNA-binding GntR family transcriptional regulator